MCVYVCVYVRLHGLLWHKPAAPPSFCKCRFWWGHFMYSLLYTYIYMPYYLYTCTYTILNYKNRFILIIPPTYPQHARYLRLVRFLDLGVLPSHKPSHRQSLRLSSHVSLCCFFIWGVLYYIPLCIICSVHFYAIFSFLHARNVCMQMFDVIMYECR